MTGPDVLSINGVALPPPMTYSVEYNDLDSDETGRSEDGKLHRKRVRSNVAKIQVSWEQLTQDKADLILNAIDPASFSVSYYFGTLKTATMYAGNRKCKLLRINYNQPKWDISFDLIEF